MRPSFGLILLFFFCSFSGRAGDTLIPRSDLEESLRPSANVLGSEMVLKGVQRGDDKTALSLPRFAVVLPEKAQGELCLHLSTGDGRYHANRSYSIVSAGTGIVPLQLYSKFPADLATYHAEELAALAEIKAACDAPGDGVIVPVLFDQSQNDVPVILNLATKKSTARVKVTMVSGKETAIACDEILQGSKTIFDHRCVINVSHAEWSQVSKIEIIITGLTGSSRTEEYPVQVGAR